MTAAAERIRGYVRRTPSVALEPGAFGVPGRLTLKLELLQHSGSFKARGAYNLLLSSDVPAAGVVAASGGNFGLAVAHAARRLGVPATVFVPESSPDAKVSALRRLDADVVVTGAYYAEALDASRERVAETGALFAHAYDDPAVVAGAGPCGTEMADVDTVLVAVGGGGLAGGVATWFGDSARVVAVETERTPTLSAALAAGEPVDVEVGGIAASSLGARRLGANCWAARHWIDAALLVPDEAVVATQRALWESLRVVAEPGGAAALAALLSGAYVAEPDERVTVLVCGANVDPGSVG